MAAELLLLAARADDVAEAERLVVIEGASVEARNGNGETALHLAAEQGSARMIAVLLAHGAAVDARRSGALGGATPLLLAARRGWLEAAETLLVCGDADPNVATVDDQRTPLHDAAQCGNIAMIKLLLSAGADGAARDVDGANPAHLARVHGHKALLAAGLLPAPAAPSAEELVAHARAAKEAAAAAAGGKKVAGAGSGKAAATKSKKK
jgi:ankyrin repeat protein